MTSLKLLTLKNTSLRITCVLMSDFNQIFDRYIESWICENVD